MARAPVARAPVASSSTTPAIPYAPDRMRVSPFPHKVPLRRGCTRDVVERLAAVPPGLLQVKIYPFCGFHGWAGCSSCLVDVTLYLLLRL